MKSSDTNNNSTQLEESSSGQRLIPISRTWFESVFYALVLIWLIYLYSEARTFTRFEDYLLPYLLMGVGSILILIQLIRINFPEKVSRFEPDDPEDDTGDDDLKNRLDEASETERHSPAKRQKYEVLMIGWVTCLPIMMYFIGMGWTILIYVFAYTWFFIRDWGIQIKITLGLAAFIVILFMYVLEMIIWTGVFGFPDPLVYVDRLIDNL